jgi:plasmanylethanolamine desaturase
MKDSALLLIEILGTIIAADFFAGLIHWAEDAYIREQTPLLGKWIGRANTLHHHLPRFMTRNSWWQSSWDLLLAMTLILITAATLGVLTWHVWLFSILAANANEVHKWSHRSRKENGKLISALQDWRIIQTPKHHALHHTNPKEVHYCPLTNVLNPVLDKLHFWAGLECALATTTGLNRKPDTSVTGPEPEWISPLRVKRS